MKTYITPTTSDNSIQYYHVNGKNISKPWSKFIEDSANFTNDLSREEVFDRYNDHTKNCISCSRTLNNIKVIQNTLPSLLLIHSIHNNNIIEIILAVFIYSFCNNFKTFLYIVITNILMCNYIMLINVTIYILKCCIIYRIR